MTPKSTKDRPRKGLVVSVVNSALIVLAVILVIVLLAWLVGLWLSG